MRSQLPHNPSLQSLKKQARHLQRALANDDPDAIKRAKKRITNISANTPLAKSQTIIAREHGFPSWPKLKAFIEIPKPTGLMPDALTPDQNSFIHAIRANDVSTVQKLLDLHPEFANLRIAGCDSLLGKVYEVDRFQPVQPNDNRSSTVLRHAAKHGFDRIIQLLIDHNADVNAIGYEGSNAGWCTPLHLAAWEGTTHTVEQLLNAGADTNALNSFGQTPLNTAIRHNAKEKINLLLQHGANPTLHEAITLGDANLVPSRLQLDSDLANILGSDDHLPLDLAAQHNQIDIAQILIEHGAQLSPIHAAGLGMIDHLKTFVQQNPGCVNQTSSNYTPAIIASQNGHADTLQFLIDHGADINLSIPDGPHNLQPIDVAHANVVDILAEAGADTCHVYRGYTPLMRAIECGWPHYNDNAVQPLLKHGGIKRFYITGKWTGHANKIEKLIQLGADINEKDPHGHTALHHALQLKNNVKDPATPDALDQIIALLRKHGAE